MRAARTFVAIFALIFFQTVLISFHFDPGSAGTVIGTPANHEHERDDDHVANGDDQDELFRIAMVAFIVIVPQPDKANAQPSNFDK